MRILVHDHGGYPFATQLSRTLARRGHDVLHLHAGGLRTPRGESARRTDDPATLEIQGVGVREQLIIGAGVRRVLQEGRYARALAARVRQYRPDVVLSGNGPLVAHANARRAAHDLNSGFVFWLHDIYSIAVGRLLGRRLPLLGRALSRPYARVEHRLLQNSDAVVATSPDFLPVIQRLGARLDTTAVIENWAPLDEVQPQPRANPWASRHGFVDAPVLLYAGTLGRKHDPTLLADLAGALPDAQVVVVSEGVGTDQLRQIASVHPNLRLLPLQPPEDLPDVLASADVLVAILEHDAHTFSVPSKVLTYLAAGRPILAAIPPANLAARTIERAGAGAVVDPKDRHGFIAAARMLLADQGARDAAGRSARDYAERTFDIERIADRFERILEVAQRGDRSSIGAAAAKEDAVEQGRRSQ